MLKFFFPIATLFGASAVILGAFGAHTLKTRISAEQLSVFETAVKYQFYHTFALIIVALLAVRNESPLLTWSGNLFIAGIFLFSGSLYLLSTRTLLNTESWTWLGPVTPLGGMAFITGWILLFIFSVKKQML